MKTKLIFTTFALIVAMVSVQAEVYTYIKINGLYYNLDATTQTAQVTYKYFGSSNSSGTSNSSYVSGKLTIPETVTYNGTTYSVTSIGNMAFWGCSSLTSVTIPNSVIIIGTYAFSKCSGLTSVTIPNSVIIIGGDAFTNCSSLTSITIPESVTSIHDHAFSKCSSLTSVTIPNSVTYIGNDAFEDCSSLTSVTIPNSVTSIESSTFYNCSSLTSITIPNSVTRIGSSAFSNCSSLTSVTIPNSVTRIGEWAFSRCSSLTSVTIPNSVTSIGDEAFRSCSSLSSIYNYAKVPQSIDSNVFEEVNKNTCVLYVPKESVEAYKNAPVWKDFKQIVGVDVPEDTAIDEVFTQDNTSSTRKVIENGHIYLLTPDGRKLNIQGAEVK